MSQYHAWKQTFIGITAIFALAFTACDDGNGDEDTHTHEYRTTWSKDAAQHWHECSCGDKTDIALHEWEWVQTTDPTLESEGEETGTCRICGLVRSASSQDNYDPNEDDIPISPNWNPKQEAESLIANDPAFAEIISFAISLGNEIEYDWATLKSYNGAPVIRTPGKRYHQCGGYAREVMDKAILLNSVKTVQHWRVENLNNSGTSHSWNVLKLKDGRTLYFDLTRFSNNRINTETGRVYQVADYRWSKITFNAEGFRNSSIYYPPGTLRDEVRATTLMAGNGTEMNPYIVTTAEQLAAVALWVKSGDIGLSEKYNSAYYRLGNNISLSVYTSWSPIGTSSRNFNGVFDGNNKVINSLSISTANNIQGLFGDIRGGTVKNLGVENININGGNNLGGIVARIDSSSVISNCFTTGTITGGAYVGGIVGHAQGGSTITNCYSTVDVTGSDYVGGIAGGQYNPSGVTNPIANCAALSQSVICTGSNVGRISGANYFTRTNNIAFAGIINSSSTADWSNKTLVGKSGLDITKEQIFADGTLGGRFTPENGWTVENGKLPGFGRALDLPQHLR